MWVLDTILNKSTERGLTELYTGDECGLKCFLECERKWSKDNNPERYKRCERLLNLDGDELQFAKLLKEDSNGKMAKLSIADVKYKLQLPKLTINSTPFS